MEKANNKIGESIEKRVMNEFAMRLNITATQLIRHNKCSSISDIRHLYCKLRHDKHGVSYAKTGREINRSHTAVKYGVMRINDMLQIEDSKIVDKWNLVKNISGSYE